MSYSCERCGTHLDDLATQCGCDLPPTKAEIERAKIGWSTPSMDAVIAERDRLAAENAELKRRDDIVSCERAEAEIALAAANAAHAQLVIDYEQVLADLEQSDATLEKLREVGIDPGYHGNPADWAVEDRLDTLIQFQAILYPKETTDEKD